MLLTVYPIQSSYVIIKTHQQNDKKEYTLSNLNLHESHHFYIPMSQCKPVSNTPCEQPLGQDVKQVKVLQGISIN